MTFSLIFTFINHISIFRVVCQIHNLPAVLFQVAQVLGLWTQIILKSKRQKPDKSITYLKYNYLLRDTVNIKQI